MAYVAAGASVALPSTGLAPGSITFCLVLGLMQVVAATVVYSSAFVAIVPLGGQ